MTSWAIRGGKPVDAIDNTDMVTPWVVDAFTRMWDEVQQRINRHRAGTSGDDPNGSPIEAEDEFGPPPF